MEEQLEVKASFPDFLVDVDVLVIDHADHLDGHVGLQAVELDKDRGLEVEGLVEVGVEAGGESPLGEVLHVLAQVPLVVLRLKCRSWLLQCVIHCGGLR